MIISEAFALAKWLAFQDTELALAITRQDASMILNYLEGHDYSLGCDNFHELIVTDVHDSTDFRRMRLHELITMIAEWNSGLLEDYSQLMQTAVTEESRASYNNKCDLLQEEGRRLTQLEEIGNSR